MPPDLIERHGIDFDEVRAIGEAFGRGDLDRAVALTTPDMVERFSVAGDQDDWIGWIRSEFEPSGFTHLAPTFVDPTLAEVWSGRRAEGIPDLAGQARLLAERVLPSFR
jgi:5,10-methylenetetrahydromethanopterin reductase